MRGLRRIAGAPRYSAKVEMTDLEVRRKLQAPSIDSLMLSARMRYLKRIISLRPTALISVLHMSTNDGKAMPWVRMILNDAEMLRSLDALPPDPQLNKVRITGAHIDSPQAGGELATSIEDTQNACPPNTNYLSNTQGSTPEENGMSEQPRGEWEVGEEEYQWIIQREVAHHWEIARVEKALGAPQVKLVPMRSVTGVMELLGWLKGAGIRPEDKDPWMRLGLCREGIGGIYRTSYEVPEWPRRSSRPLT